jgi:hypothetical protein
MSWLMVAFIGLAAVSADIVVETASELFAETMLDSDAGASVEVAAGPASDVIDTMPQATVLWTRR